MEYEECSVDWRRFLHTSHMMPAGDDPRVSATVEIEHWATLPGAVLGAFLVFARGIFPLAVYLTGNFIPLVACYSVVFFLEIKLNFDMERTARHFSNVRRKKQPVFFA